MMTPHPQYVACCQWNDGNWRDIKITSSVQPVEEDGAARDVVYVEATCGECGYRSVTVGTLKEGEQFTEADYRQLLTHMTAKVS